MAESPSVAEPRRLTDVLDEDVLRVLAAGYSITTRSHISVMELDRDDRVHTVQEDVLWNTACRRLEHHSVACEVCHECDEKHVRDVLQGRIQKTTPYLCPFGRVEIIIPVLIGARPVGAFFGGQVPWHYWPRAAQEKMISLAVKEDKYLTARPGDLAQADRLALERTLNKLRKQGADDLEADELMREAEHAMAEHGRETDVERYLSELETTALVIENLANDKYFADLLPHLSALIEGEQYRIAADTPEDFLWDGAQRALGVVRNMMGFSSAAILVNSPETPGRFVPARMIGVSEAKQRWTEKHKGPLALDSQRLARTGYSRADVVQKLTDWLPGHDVDPVIGFVLELDPEAHRFGLIAFFGSDSSVEKIEHPADAHNLWMDRIGQQLSGSIQRRFTTIAFRQRAEMQEQYAMDLSHELKAPVQSILAEAQGLIRRARRGNLTDEAIARAESRLRIERRAILTRTENVSLLAVFQDIHLTKEPLRLEEIAQESVARHRATAEENGSRLTRLCDKADALCRVNVDRERLVLAVDNLIQNAVKYSYQNTEIRVETVATSESAILRVINMGARIPPGKITDIFDKFVRLTEEESQFGFRPGTGIGLSLVKRIVDLHEGEVTARSEQLSKDAWPPNHAGPAPYRNTFTVTLPRHDSPRGHP